MGARTTCRVFKSDNMLLLYFKLIFTTTHHFQLFGGRIEKPDVNHSAFTPSQSSPSCDPRQVPVSRSKRKVDQSKTTCLLHLHADHRFFKRFGSVEAVVAQVSSHNAQKIHSTLIRCLHGNKHDIFPVDSKVLPLLVHNLPEVGFTACSFLNPTGDFCEIVGLCVTIGQVPSSLLWLWKTKVFNLFW